MEIKKYIVVSCEHTTSFCEPPMLCASFDYYQDALDYVNKCVLKSCEEFPNEEEVEEGLVKSFDEAGNPDYGCIWTIIDTEKEKGFPL